MPEEFIAHRVPETGREQGLADHLTGVAELAASFGASFGAEAEARLCGLMHDVGKYAPAFQRRVRGDTIRVAHAYAGAVECVPDMAAAFCIAGHHAGLADRGARTDDAQKGTLLGTLSRRPAGEREDYASYKKEIAPLCAAPAQEFLTSRASAFFYIHMLYSCLVDADWLDTERFVSEGAVERGTGRPLGELSAKLDDYVAPWWRATEMLNVRRCAILRQLMAAGTRRPGLYSLTVPTGGGKTVSSMAFALRHAVENGQRRIIYVIPYCSILEQTQGVFEAMLGKENVVAHYANVEYSADENGQLSEGDRRRYLAAENWDAPVILTTAVQFFESLYANRPAACRKLHNIARSVIIFDEAQMLPVNYLQPCVLAITELVKRYGCTGVLCTATQPALGPLIGEYLPAGAEELYDGAGDGDGVFRRVSYRYEGLLPDEELAARLSAQEQVLCIVNSRLQAQTLYACLPTEGRYHLSTAMTPHHRRRVLGEIRRRLAGGQPCRVVSTSLIEAGVDVDFPCVYRAMAGLDAIIQAAGRCNREGRRAPAESVVHIFDTAAKPPPALKQNIAAARRVIGQFGDIAAPEAIKAYFDFLLYTLMDERARDEKQIIKLATEDMAFRTVSERFHLIEDTARTVYIPVGEGAALVRRLREDGPSRGLMRTLGQYAVSVYDRTYKKLEQLGAVEALFENAAVLQNMDCYDEQTGLCLSPEGGDALFG